MNNRSFGLILISAFLLLLSGCAPMIKNDQPDHTGWLTLGSEHSLGQTFTARYAGLQGIAILLEPETASDVSLELNLYDYDQRDTPLRTAIIHFDTLEPASFQRFNFGNIPLSNQVDYYLRLSLQGTGKMKVGTGPGASYLNGAAYLDDVAQDQQIVFRLAYSPTIAVRGLLLEGMGWLFNLSIGFLLFVIPGWGVLSMIFPGWRALFWAEKIGLGAGVSLAIYPILILWTNLVGLRLGIFSAWLPILVGIILMFWKFANRSHTLGDVRKLSVSNLLCNLATIGVLAIILFTRLWPVRGLDAPMWGDSLQHTIISQLIVDHHGLFTSWEPYAELTSFTYHFGFHSLVAAFHWMTGMEMSQAVLWTGQLVNVLSLLVLVPLANRLGGNRWAGVIALTVAGLLTSIPQIYANWGRYTQLTGQVILVVFVYVCWIFLRDHVDRPPMAGLSAGLLAGLALTHTRILILALTFLLVYFIAYLRTSGFIRLIKPILLISLISLLIFLPWLIRILPGTITQLLVAQVTTPASQLSASATQAEEFFQYTRLIPTYLWLLSGAALLLGLWRRDKMLLLFCGWWLAVILVGYPHWIGLPGSGIVGGFTVMIAAYIPVGLLVGYGISLGFELLSSRVPRPHLRSAMSIGFAVLILAAGLASFRLRLNDVQVQESTLFTRGDQHAAEWIAANLPDDSLILVNAFLAYDNAVAVGSDGGWWLPFKARRAVTLPPINYTFETGPAPNYRQQVIEIPAAILEKGISDPEVQSLLDEHGVTHIYLGQQQGSVNYAGPPIQAEQLLALNSYRQIYHEDRVWIFERNLP